MAIKKIRHLIERVFEKTWDIDHIQNAIFNQYTSSQKGMQIQPVIKSAYVANTQVEFGTLIKITTAGVYSQKCVGKAYDATYKNYRRGSIVTQGGFVYIANSDFQSGVPAGTFDSSRWTKVAPDTISGIPNAAGDVVCTGKYHNAIDVAGFVVEDDISFRPKSR